ncbi:sigma-70 family RNA polymerase sigma factor [Paenibacillus agaridevorans]|uniref:sigma-70 family RNA polymerase sigma factor n=1 Tax=Paenibacillus agaridevorans TaxID=171404 RepID=UPI001BE48458|nr:sigma-70 family RNA polymerase sigma factor [Paenibacillus agaridevorans]
MERSIEHSKLAAEALAGGREAYSRLYSETVREVYQTVRFLVREASDADDVVQDIYLAMFRSFPRYDPARPFRPWLMGIAMRQIRNHRRKRWMQLRIAKKAEAVQQTAEYDFSGDITDRLSRNSLAQNVEKLPYKLKQTVILHYFHEYTQEEIALILGIPLGTVKSRIHAALQTLRRKRQLGLFGTGKVEELHES